MFGTDLLWDEGKVYLRVSYLLILIGLFFKLGLVPFHFWIPDVYEGSTWLVIYMLGVVSKIGAFGVTVRLIYQVFDFEFEMTSLLLVLVGFGSIGVGVLSALRQRSLKRLVGYSGITHMGFLVLGLSTGTGLGMFVTFFYLIFYLCLNVSWIVLFRYLELESLEELKRVLGSVGIYLLIMIFSIVGIPPLGGFFIKFFLLFSLIQVEFWIPVILIIVGSLVAAYYYLRLVQMVYFTEKDERSLVKEDLGSLYVLGGLSYTNLFLIVGQNYIWI
jgi:NADH-quinone oxidoreductase subunit N